MKPNLGQKPRTALLAAVLLCVALLSAACGSRDEEASLPTQSREPALQPTEDSQQPSATGEFIQVSDEELLSFLRAIPVYPGSTPSDPAFPDGLSTGGEARRGFAVEASSDDVLAFYQSGLPNDGWLSDGEVYDESWETPGAGATFRRLQQVFTRGQVQALLVIDPSPKAGPGAEYYFVVVSISYPIAQTIANSTEPVAVTGE